MLVPFSGPPLRTRSSSPITLNTSTKSIAKSGHPPQPTQLYQHRYLRAPYLVLPSIRRVTCPPTNPLLPSLPRSGENQPPFRYSIKLVPHRLCNNVPASTSDSRPSADSLSPYRPCWHRSGHLHIYRSCLVAKPTILEPRRVQPHWRHAIDPQSSHKAFLKHLSA